MIKKIVFFILSLLLILLLTFTWCLFVWPCKTKIKEYVPEQYTKYLDFTNISGEEQKGKVNMTIADINNNAWKDIWKTEEDFNDFWVKVKQEKGEKYENKIEEVKDIKKENNEEKQEEEKLVDESEKINEEIKKDNIKENDWEIQKNNIEEKTEEVKNNDEGLNEEKKMTKEEIKRKLKERLEAKREKGDNSDQIEKKEKIKKMTFVTTVNWVKKTLEVEKYLGNGIYYTSSGDLYLWENKIKKVQDIDNFSIKKIWDNIALLEEKKWNWKEIFLIDIKEKKSYKIFDDSKISVSKAKKVNKKIVFLLKSNYIDWWVFVFDIEKSISKKVFSNSENNIQSNDFKYRKIKDFNIFPWNIGNSLIEVIYEWQNNTEMKKIIWGLK